MINTCRVLYKHRVKYLSRLGSHTPRVQRRKMSADHLVELRKYSACDISDALLVVEKDETASDKRRTAGFLCDLAPRNLSSSTRADSKTIVGPAFTVEFKESNYKSASETSNIHKGSQWSDCTDAHSIVVVQQPPEQHNACVGGIHMMRLFKRDVKGLVVAGRVRDVSQARELDIPIWSLGTSTVGAGAECKPWYIQKPITISEVTVTPGDIIAIDETEGGIVRIPQDKVVSVLDWLRNRGDSEDKIMRMVMNGGSVAEAFKQFR